MYNTHTDSRLQGWAVFREPPTFAKEVEAVYLNAGGQEIRETFSIVHDRIDQGEADKLAVRLIRERLAQQGRKLKALWDISDDCFRRLLYRAGKR